MEIWFYKTIKRKFYSLKLWSKSIFWRNCGTNQKTMKFTNFWRIIKNRSEKLQNLQSNTNLNQERICIRECVLSCKYYSVISIKSDNTFHIATDKRHKCTHATWKSIVQCCHTTMKPELKTTENKKLLIIQLIKKESFQCTIYKSL